MICNLEAEQTLLGCIFVEPDLIKEVTLSPEHFYKPSHRLIFQTMREIEKCGELIDLVTVSTSLKNCLHEMGGISYLTELSASVASVEPYKTYEKYILETWKLRQAEMIANQIKQNVEIAKDSSVIHESIQQLIRLDEVGNEDDFNLSKLLDDMEEDFKQDQGDLTGIDTGYADLNQFTNGWQDQDLVIVAARPSVGKTAFALNMAQKSALNGVVTTIFSLEMGEKSLMKRMLSSLGKIDAIRMRNPLRLFNTEDWWRFKNSKGILKKCPLFIYDNPTVTVQTIRAKIRKLKRKHPDKKHICFIDYLTLIKGNGKENRVQEVGEITRSLKVMAREFDMPFIALAQLSRSVEQRQDKRPMMSDLRDSGEIEQHADIIAFLYREDYYDQETENKDIIEIIIAKHRNGPTGTVKLLFLKEYNQFLELSRR